MDQALARVSSVGEEAVADVALAQESSGTTESERNPIFDALVSTEGEVSGLVAYSLYKQNKRAWLDDFVKATGRTPTEAETRAYIIGESTERRLSTYRQLAGAALGGKSDSGSSAPGGAMTGALWVAVALIALAVFALAVHVGVFSPAK